MYDNWTVCGKVYFPKGFKGSRGDPLSHHITIPSSCFMVRLQKSCFPMISNDFNEPWEFPYRDNLGIVVFPWIHRLRGKFPR